MLKFVLFMKVCWKSRKWRIKLLKRTIQTSCNLFRCKKSSSMCGKQSLCEAYLRGTTVTIYHLLTYFWTPDWGGADWSRLRRAERKWGHMWRARSSAWGRWSQSSSAWAAWRWRPRWWRDRCSTQSGSSRPLCNSWQTARSPTTSWTLDWLPEPDCHLSNGPPAVNTIKLFCCSDDALSWG